MIHARHISEYWYDLAHPVSEGMSSILWLEACALRSAGKL